jgi:hypothetical protein
VSYWPWILVPALATALVINVDARFTGPYFSLSSLISSTEGIEARNFISDSALRNALLRRFTYPLILGFLLAWHLQNRGDIGASGAIAASLLIWPVLFHPFPDGIKRKRDIGLLYFFFIGVFFLMALLGAYLKMALVDLSEGRVLKWIENQMLWMILIGVTAFIFSSFYRAIFDRIAKKADG